MTITYFDDLPPFTRDLGAFADQLRWSNALPPPRIGDTVLIAVNACGPAKVLRYFAEEGYLGVLCQLLDPPDFYVKQNGADTPAHVFGAEILIEPVRKADNTGRAWVLAHDEANRRPAFLSERVTSFRGDQALLAGGDPPQRYGTSGYVYTKADQWAHEARFYPSVFDLRWRLEPLEETLRWAGYTVEYDPQVGWSFRSQDDGYVSEPEFKTEKAAWTAADEYRRMVREGA